MNDIYDPTIPKRSPELGELSVLLEQAERTESLARYDIPMLRGALAASEEYNVSNAAKAHLMDWIRRKVDQVVDAERAALTHGAPSIGAEEIERLEGYSDPLDS